MATRRNVTDRAHRYRAQKNVTGAKKCVICGSKRYLDVMHLDGDESHGQPSNLAYGCRSCNNKLAAAFKRVGKGRPTNQYNPAQGVPTFQQYAWAVANHSRGEFDEGGAIIHATPKDVRIDYAQRIAGIKRSHSRDNPWPFSREDARQRTPAHGGIAFHQGRKKPDLNREFLEKADKTAGRYKGYAISKTSDGEFVSSLDRDSTFSTKAQAQRHIDQFLKGRSNPSLWFQTKTYAQGEVDRLSVQGIKARIVESKGKQGGYHVVWSKRNPAAATDAAFEEFHGFAPKETIKVRKKRHYHKHLPAAGELRGLSVRPIGHGLPVRHIGGLKGAILAFNENKNQLFVEGGDQFLSDAELRNFGIRKPHEIETLGKVTALDYFTSKTHLGKEGGTAVYAHRLRTTNENGRHVTVVIARYPDLIYRVMDQQLEFSGGSYEIRAEGIDK